MAFFEIEIKGLKNISDMAVAYPRVSEKHITKAIRLSLERVYREIGQTAPKSTGNLARNWERILGRFQGSLRSGVNYAIDVHEGTKPHHVPAEALRLWAKPKGLNPFAVSKIISRKGTKSNPFMTRSLKRAKSGIETEMSKAIDAILKELSK
jgi:hypothetical protein